MIRYGEPDSNVKGHDDSPERTEENHQKPSVRTVDAF
jgi:hypothetical protein